MSKPYNTMTNVSRDDAFIRKANTAFGVNLFTPEAEAAIDRGLGIAENVVCEFLSHIRNPVEVQQDDMDDMKGPSRRDLAAEERAIKNEGI